MPATPRALDIVNGRVHFDGLSLEIGPDLDLATFEAHADRSRFQPFIVNPPHVSFRFDGAVDGDAAGGVLWFQDGRLRAVNITLVEPGVTSWEDYDPARARRLHDDWLEARLGRGKPWQAGHDPYGGIEYHYSWGTVGSYLHPQDQNPTIRISYEH